MTTVVTDSVPTPQTKSHVHANGEPKSGDNGVLRRKSTVHSVTGGQLTERSKKKKKLMRRQ